MGNPEECPQEWGHGSLKGYATVLRRRINGLRGGFRREEEQRKREIHFRLGEKVFQKRCGGRGLRVFAGRIPAASDLVGIYEDVGTRLVGNIERPLVSILNLCIRWGGDRRYPNTTGDYPFERKIFPSVSST